MLQGAWYTPGRESSDLLQVSWRSAWGTSESVWESWTDHITRNHRRTIPSLYQVLDHNFQYFPVGVQLFRLTCSATLCDIMPILCTKMTSYNVGVIIVGLCGRVGPHHTPPKWLFFGALRHRTQVDVVQDGTNCHGCGSSPSVCVDGWFILGAMIALMHHSCAAPPSQSPISLTQARWGCKPATNNTHSTHTLHSLFPPFSSQPACCYCLVWAFFQIFCAGSTINSSDLHYTPSPLHSKLLSQREKLSCLHFIILVQQNVFCLLKNLKQWLTGWRPINIQSLKLKLLWRKQLCTEASGFAAMGVKASGSSPGS